MPETAVECRSLSKSFRDGTRALIDVDVAVDRGEFVSIIGRSGAGKSTLLRCMNRLIDPTSGTITLMGEDVTAVSGNRLRRVRQRVGMIFQQFNLVSRLTVLQNVLTGRLRFCTGPIKGPMALFRQFSRADHEIAMRCLDEVGIAQLAPKRADELSGGQQQRVAIARLLAQDPGVILADEPVASLDPASSEVVMSTLARINAEHGVPVLVNLHQVELARQYSTRVIGMRAGRLAIDLPPDRLDAEALSGLYDDEPSDAAVPGDRAPRERPPVSIVSEVASDLFENPTQPAGAPAPLSHT